MQKNITPAAPKVRRPLSDAQKAVLPLRPIFEACKKAGLPVTPDNCETRLRAVNRYFNLLDGFDWIETSFKELVARPAAIVVVADAIESGVLAW